MALSQNGLQLRKTFKIDTFFLGAFISVTTDILNLIHWLPLPAVFKILSVGGKLIVFKDFFLKWKCVSPIKSSEKIFLIVLWIYPHLWDNYLVEVIFYFFPVCLLLYCLFWISAQIEIKCSDWRELSHQREVLTFWNSGHRSILPGDRK